MKVSKRIISLFLSIIMLVTLVAQPALAIEANNPDTKDPATDVAPENYKPQNTILKKSKIKAYAESEETKKVLLIEDQDPWNTTSNQDVLSQITQYDKISTEDFLSVDLTKYAVVVFANDQPFSTYENYKSFKKQLESFASIGGVIVFGACDGGWADSYLAEDLPGGVKKELQYEYQNYIADYTHPIVTGSLIDNKMLQNSELDWHYASHTVFNESTFPAGTKVILRETSTDKPTLIEYPLGKGRVIASGLTWEHNYAYSNDPSTSYAKTAMADMFKYAIRVSNIDVNDLKTLEDYYLKNNSHHIIIGSRSTSLPIKGAKVVIDGKQYIADDKGVVNYSGSYGEKTVTVSAEGYRKNQLIYNLQPKNAQLVFLENDTKDGLPYFTMVRDMERTYDLRIQTVRYIYGDKKMLRLKVAGDWGANGTGKYYLYQEGVKGGAVGKQLTSTNGEFNFAPGITLNPDQPVKLKMVAGNGKSSTPIAVNLVIDEPIKPSEDQVGSELENTTSYSIAKEQKGSVKDDTITAVFPGDFTLKAPSLPIKMNKSVDEKGIATYRLAIGVTEDNMLKDDSKWDTYKEDVEKAKKNLNKSIDFLINEYGPTKKSFPMEKTLWDPKVSGVGYVEIKQDKKGKIIQNTGGVVLTGSNKSVYSRQFFYGPVPIYLDLSGEVEISLQSGIGYSNEKKSLINDGELSITPTAALGGGLGISGVATVGVEGQAGLKIEIFPEPNPGSTGTFQGAALIKAYVLWVFDYQYTIGKFSKPLWSKREEEANLLGDDYKLSEPKLSLSSRDYNQKTTQWNTGRAKKNLSIIGDQSASLLTLQDWIIPNTIPQITKVDDKLVMLFQSDDKTRKTGDNTVLMYSVFTNGVWSEPKPVWESDTADFFAKPFVYNNELYVLWQKAKAKVTKTDVNDMLKEVSANSEISFAKWNKNTQKFESQRFITKNNILDMYPTIASNGKEVSAVWVSNSANDPLGKSGTYSVMKSTLTNGVWSAPKAVYQTKQYITELAAGYVNNSLSIAYGIKAEEGKPNIYLVIDGSAKAISGNNHAEALKFGENNFYWQSNGSVMEYAVSKGSLSTLTAGDKSVVTSSYKFVKNNSKTALVWSAADDEGSHIYASIKTDKGWSSPISLFISEDAIQFMDVELMNNGEWKVIANILQKVGDDSKNSLVFVNVNTKTDVELNYAIADDSKKSGNLLPVNYGVTNLGENDVKKLNVKIYTDKNVYFTKTVPCNIKPGETWNFIEKVDVSKVASETDATVSVLSDDESDITNNTDHLTLGKVDVSLSLSQYKVDNKLIVVANVSNKSDIPANTAISVIEGAEDGIVLDVKNIGELSKTSDYRYMYSIDLDKVDFAGANSKTYRIKVQTKEADINNFDNSDVLVVYNEKVKEISDKPPVNVNIVNATGVSVAPKKVTLLKDYAKQSSIQLNAEIKPKNATYKGLTWSSSNTKVAAVDGKGKVTAVGKGTATITATTLDGGYRATCAVTVTTAIHVTKVSMNKTSTTLAVGATETLKATVAPMNATNKELKWSSSNAKVATVSSKGVVTAKGAGTATITVTSVDGSHKATCMVKVNKVVKVKGIKLNKTKTTLYVRAKQTLKATITPSNATNKGVTWTSSNTKVATVSTKGVVIAKGKGTAMITVKTKDGSYKSTCKVTVKVHPVKGVKLNKKSLSLKVRGKSTLKATITPSNATNKGVTWSSSNKKVATVSKSGVVTAKGKGTATITVKTKDGSYKAKCKVTVKKK
ncbi:Ig-like domain-containing protein [Neobacillus sp. M.A.Huq-85]